MTVTTQEATTTTLESGVIVRTNNDWRMEYKPDSWASINLGALTPTACTPETQRVDPTSSLYDLIRAACTWHGDGQGVAEQGAITVAAQMRTVERMRVELSDERRRPQQAVKAYKHDLRAGLLDAYYQHRSHVALDDLNAFLDEHGMDPLKIEFTVSVYETARRVGTVTVEAASEDAARDAAYELWENGVSVDWDSWDEQESDTDEYEVEEA